MLLDGAVARRERRGWRRAEFGQAAGAELEIHVEEDKTGENTDRQRPAHPSLLLHRSFKKKKKKFKNALKASV